MGGIRRDVTVVCLALANTDWYMRQLRDAPARPLDEARAARGVAGSDHSPARPGRCMRMTDSMVAVGDDRTTCVRGAQQIALGPAHAHADASGTVLYPSDILILSVIQQNLGRRPIVWAATAGRSFAGLGDYVVQRGLGFELLAARPDTISPQLDLHRFARRAARHPDHRAPGVRYLSLRRAARARRGRAGDHEHERGSHARAAAGVPGLRLRGTGRPRPDGAGARPGRPAVSQSRRRHRTRVPSWTPPLRDTGRVPAADRPGPLQQRPNLK